MKKSVVIDFDICDPKKCDPKDGKCAALKACKHNILEQEDFFDPPMIFYKSMCVGCGDCVPACPLGAVKICRGNDCN